MSDKHFEIDHKFIADRVKITGLVKMLESNIINNGILTRDQAQALIDAAFIEFTNTSGDK